EQRLQLSHIGRSILNLNKDTLLKGESRVPSGHILHHALLHRSVRAKKNAKRNSLMNVVSQGTDRMKDVRVTAAT
ncbi:MAG: hypothetical protein QXL67_00350, partial [Candidatus Bathyarchaeia archaeon]